MFFFDKFLLGGGRVLVRDLTVLLHVCEAVHGQRVILVHTVVVQRLDGRNGGLGGLVVDEEVARRKGCVVTCEIRCMGGSRHWEMAGQVVT